MRHTLFKFIDVVNPEHVVPHNIVIDHYWISTQPLHRRHYVSLADGHAWSHTVPVTIHVLMDLNRVRLIVIIFEMSVFSAKNKGQ